MTVPGIIQARSGIKDRVRTCEFVKGGKMSKTNKKRVVILGGGFAGVYTAKHLEKELGKSDEVSTRFRNALLLPDRMLAYHFTRLAAEKPTP